MNKYFCIISILILASFFTCKRKSEELTSDSNARLDFSDQAIYFDTIFSSIGSITQRLYVYNPNSHAVTISSIELGGKTASPYKIIINGQESTYTTNFELYGGDSMLVLVKVLINPQNQNLPYIVEDSLIFTTNNNIQQVKLIAFGQDANFITNAVVPCNTVWNDKKPYVIYGSATIAAGCTLTVDKGVRILSHKAAKINVNGTLLVNGIKDSTVKFLGDNLDQSFADLPGQWGGIVFASGSKNNSIVFALIRNAATAIKMNPEIDGDTIPELLISNTIIENNSKNAIEAIATDLYLKNTLVDNCAGYIVSAKRGGNYYFDFCTMANYSYFFFRSEPSVLLSNTDSLGNGNMTARFRNSIVWGDKTEEFSLVNNGTSGFNVSFDHSLLKSKLSFTATANILNQDPDFSNDRQFDFHIADGSSPAVNAAAVIPAIADDLENKSRGTQPDIGAYEK